MVSAPRRVSGAVSTCSTRVLYPDTSVQRGGPPALVVEDEYRGHVMESAGFVRKEMEVSKTISNIY